MSDNRKAYAATPAPDLHSHIMDPRVAKSEAEWWARGRIAKLEADMVVALEALKRITGADGLFAEPASGQHAREVAREALTRIQGEYRSGEVAGE